MSNAKDPKEKTDWRRIGLVAAVTLVPGGFLLGAALAMRRMRAEAERKTPEGSSADND